MGQRTDRGIRCGYHGLEFGSSGACVANPHGPVIESLRVRAYPATERYGMIWVWIGRTGSERSRRHSGYVLRVPRAVTAFSKGYLPTAQATLLLTDNILDLSHADYLHPETLGGGAMTRARARVEERKGSVRVPGTSVDETPIPIFKPLMPTPDTRGRHVDGSGMVPEWRHDIAHRRDTGRQTAGRGHRHVERPHHDARRTPPAPIIFTATAAITGWTMGTFNRMFATGLRAAFEHEDKPMIEAQQRRSAWSISSISIPHCLGSMPPP